MKSKLVALSAAFAVVCSLGASAGTVTARARSDGPDVLLPPGLMTAAAAFEHYTRGAGAIDAGFTSGSSVAKALVVGASYEPHQFQAGMVAYAALAALQDEDFVADVRAAGGERGYQGQGGGQGGGGDLAARLAADPYLVMRLDGAQHAASMAAAALAARGGPLEDAGRSVKQAAYTVQHSAWSKANIVEPAARLARIKAISAQPFDADGGDVSRALQSSATRPIRVSYGPGVPSPLVVRALALAAEAVLGEATDDPQVLAAFTSEPQQASCLKMAKLNLYQCLAVAGPHYEDIFCLGQHAMIDTGQCVLKAAGAPMGGGSQQTALH
ncbi:MAG: hypothetical protein JWP35_420 [Caulobacter sp.]|nr:hypothetical protein [Caulobacter sp.]